MRPPAACTLSLLGEFLLPFLTFTVLGLVEGELPCWILLAGRYIGVEKVPPTLVLEFLPFEKEWRGDSGTLGLNWSGLRIED